MSHFDKAIAHTLKWEGGLVNDPDDPGGITNHGVSLRFLASLGYIEELDYDKDGDIDEIDVRNMTKEQATAIYRAHFWNESYELLPLPLAIKIFDLGVNMGVRQAVKLLQECVGVKIDGRFGRNTLAACSGFRVSAFEDRAARFYHSLAAKRLKARKYLFGWLSRCYDR